LSQRLTVQRNRLDLARARDDTRQWVRDRRARTRHLIELGGLVQKAGLVDLVDDDRATLLGAFLELAGRLRDGNDDVRPADLMMRWRRRGLRAFDADKEAVAAVATRTEEGRSGMEQT
jgi:Conjugal transfer protein TraD